MADANLPTVSIPTFGYTAGTTNIGAGYAAGIESAGKSIAGGIGQVFDVATQNRNTSDALQAMNQAGILSDKAYQSVANKSLGAKQTMLGMYASQWVADQAMQRQLALQRGTGQVQYDVSHLQMLDRFNAVQGKYGPGGMIVAGVKPGQMIVNPQVAQPQTAQPQQPIQAQPIRRAQLVAPPPATPQNVAGSPTPGYAQLGTPSQGTVALQRLGPRLGPNDPIPPGATFTTIRNQSGQIVDGVMLPDGTFRQRHLPGT